MPAVNRLERPTADLRPALVGALVVGITAAIVAASGWSAQALVGSSGWGASVVAVLVIRHLRAARATAADDARRARDRLADRDLAADRAFARAPIGVACVDLRGHVVDANPALAALLGVAPAELRNRALLDLVHPEDRLAVLRARDAELRGDAGLGQRAEVRWPRAGGGTVWTALSLTLAHGLGQRCHLLAHVEDLTECRQAEEALRAREERNRLIMERLNSVVFGVDAAGRWTYVNSAWTRWTGRAVEQTLGQPVLDSLHPHDREEVRATLAPLLRGEESDAAYRHRYLAPGGQTRWAQARVRRIESEHGHLTGFVGTLDDITDRVAGEEQERQRVADLLAMTAATRSIDGEHARDELCAAARQVIGADAVLLLQPDGGDLVPRGQAGTELPPFVIPIAAGASGAVRAIATQRRSFVSDCRGHASVAQHLAQAVGAASLLFEPIVRHGRSVGVLVLVWRRPLAEPSEAALAAVDLFTAEAAAVIERMELLARLEHLALADALTGLPNRRAWQQDGERALAHAARTGEPLCIVLLDLDRFKQFNDDRGHAAGDELLRGAARAWRQELRETDVLARIGGEEFGLVLPACSHEEAVRVVERVRGVVPERQTCSAGVALWRRGETLDEALLRADEALYAAKQAGRARTVLAALKCTGEPPTSTST